MPTAHVMMTTGIAIETGIEIETEIEIATVTEIATGIEMAIMAGTMVTMIAMIATTGITSIVRASSIVSLALTCTRTMAIIAIAQMPTTEVIKTASTPAPTMPVATRITVRNARTFTEKPVQGSSQFSDIATATAWLIATAS